MKKIKIIPGLIVFLILVSCSKDFLEKAPYDQKASGTFYTNSKDASEALAAVYDILQHGGWDNIHMISEAASDNCFGASGAADGPGLQDWDGFGELSIDLNAGPWKKYFQGIYRANTFLENIDKAKWLDNEPNKAITYTAEARFLRAYFYFDLVRMFGNVPLITKVLTPSEAGLPQADPKDVYKLIAEDLKFAIENLPAVKYSSYEYGRVTKWAAEAMMARVYLYYTGYYEQSDLAGVVTKADARTYVDDVIANSGHSLLPTFESLWQYSYDKFAGEGNAETVFAIKLTFKSLNDGKLQDGNRWQVMIGLRNQTIPPYATGWGFNTVNPKLWNDFSPDDARRDGSILCWDCMGIKFNTADQREYTGYNWRKYCPLTLGPDSKTPQVIPLGGDFQISNFFDEIIIRYSDVLLMSAELHLDDNLGLAQTNFNQVRDRAFPTVKHPVTLTNDAAGKNAVMEERRFELAFEGIRYWDVLRLGMDAAKKIIDCTDPYPITFRPETRGLFKIPETQITLSNGSLKQNPGWE